MIKIDHCPKLWLGASFLAILSGGVVVAAGLSVTEVVDGLKTRRIRQESGNLASVPLPLPLFAGPALVTLSPGHRPAGNAVPWIPSTKAGNAARKADLLPQIREEILNQLRLLGIAPLSDDLTTLPDAERGRVVAGSSAVGSSAAAGGQGDAGTDEDLQLDALNRVLVEKGGLLLPPWELELRPELLYSYKGANGLLITDQGGARTIVAHDADIDRLEAAILARLGLPWRSQAEIRVPYLHVSENSSYGSTSESESEHGLGDVELALSHQLLRERAWLPDLVGELRWKTNTGRDAFDGDRDSLPLGTGFHGISGRLTAVKTVDPVVFLGSIGYASNLKDKKRGFDIDPGDAVAFSVGAILAAGPGVSLRSSFSMAFTNEAEVDGDKIPGSDKTEGVLSLGAAMTLTSRVLLDTGIGVGVTDDAPDVQTRVALSYRF